ncbi:MAG: Hsp20/alpha crystallin family protein [Thermoanaerobaculaceae bacterium]|jgi:HSP20 family protein|nr:Hsp20/alpha crystallin family protein [Thermoanaerobaculaceae bacterium]
MKRRIPSGLELEHLQRHVTELLDMLATLEAPAGGGWTPPVDILALPDRFIVRIDLPGMRPEGISVSIRDTELRVAGCKQPPAPVAPHRRFHAVERGFGHFELEIPLPSPVQCSGTTARLRQGVLEIELPRLPERRCTAHPVRIDEEEP